MNVRLRLQRKWSTLEWVVTVYFLRGGVYRRSEPDCYYTDCKEDAIETQEQMAKRFTRNGYIVESLT